MRAISARLHCRNYERALGFVGVYCATGSLRRQGPRMRLARVPAALLVAREIAKRFGMFEALRGASFTVREGEILGLIGPNGSGKTTLFECVAAIIPTDSGSVSIGDSEASADARKRALFYMPDNIRPWPDQSVEWALRFTAEISGSSPRDEAAVASALAIDHLLGSRLSSLSKGEHKRVLLAMGLLTRQPLLMLDEPFDGLDLRQTREVMTLLRQKAAEGRTLFLSIHQLADAMRICDRFVLLSDGRTVGEGTLAELRALAGLNGQSDPSLEEVFLALT
jgi:ABC-2 type transport system ATP-binding protein